MTEAQPGWYAVGDGLFESYWDGTTWIDGSKRPIPPTRSDGRPSAQPRAATARTDEPAAPRTRSHLHDPAEGIPATWAWVAVLSPIAYPVLVSILGFTSMSASAVGLWAAFVAEMVVAALCFASLGRLPTLPPNIGVLIFLAIFVPFALPPTYLANEEVRPKNTPGPRWGAAVASSAVSFVAFLWVGSYLPFK